MIKIVFVLITSTLLASCMFNPHTEKFTPAIQGVLTDSGTPLKNVRIVMSRPGWPDSKRGCQDIIFETKTNESGYFTFPSDDHFMFFTLLGDAYFTWEICAYLDEDPMSIWFGSAIGIVSERDEVEIKCEISQTPIETNDGYVLCRTM